MPATIVFDDMSVVVTPPTGYLEPLPLPMGPAAQGNDVRMLFVSGSESAPGGVAEAVKMNPDPPTGFTSQYSLNAGFETRGVYTRSLLAGDPDTSVAWVKPSGWLDFMFGLVTARGVDPATAPVAGDLTGLMTHNVQDSTLSIGSVTVPAAGVMVFCLWVVGDPEGVWPSWAAATGCPVSGGWQNLVATDKSGQTFYSFDTNPSAMFIGNKYTSAGSTGTVTIPVGVGSHAFAGMYCFLRPAPDGSSTGSAVTTTAVVGSPSSSSATDPASVGSPVTTTASLSCGFNPLIGYLITDPYTLNGDPVSASIVKWALGPAVPVISSVGPLYAANGTALTTLSVTTVNVGDVILLTTAVGSNTVTATGVSGGNAINWTRIVAPVNDSTIVVNVDLWMGVVNAVGTANITVAYSGSIVGLPCYYDAKMFTANAGPTTAWAVDGTQASGADHATSLTLAYPSLTASGANELYYGMAWSGSTTGVAGSTPGFSYALDAIGRIAAWSTATSGTVAPTASQATTARYISSAVLLVATVPAATSAAVTVETSINNQLSWDVATNGGPIPRLRNGDTTTRTVHTRVTFTRVNPTDAVPSLASLRVDPYCAVVSDELIPTFYGQVDKTTTKITAGSSGGTGGGGSGAGVNASGGGSFGGGAVVKVHATDPSRLIKLAQWQQVFTGPTGITYDQLGKAIVLNRRPNQTLFNQVSTNQVVDNSLLVWGLGQGASDPWQDIRGVFTQIGQECFYDVIGAFNSRPVPDPRSGAVVWDFDHTQRPCIIGAESELDTSLITNGFVIIGQSTTSVNPVNAFAFNTDTASKYNIFPPPVGIGLRIQKLRFSLAQTVDQCQSIANGLLFNSLGLANTVTIGIVAHPGIAAGDIARINSPETGVMGRFLIQGYELMDGLDQMRLTCFRQTDNP